jgi:iron complex transport system ATP-binding protein
MSILEFENLSAGYGGEPVIRDIRFFLEKGDLVTILGPNGSGKSTLLRAAQGLLDDVSGEVRVEGAAILSLKRREIARRIAFVPQIFDATFEFSVFELVAMGRFAHQPRISGLSPGDRRIIEEVLKLLEIRPLRDQTIGRLSGGERQRVFIARALAQDTPVLFLDEPTSHLDINYGQEIFEILAGLQKDQGKTILATEHNINLVIPYSQKIIFLRDGRIHAQGLPAEMVTREHIWDVFRADVDIRENIHSRLPEISLVPKKRERRP